MKMRFALLIATSLLAGCVTYEPTNPESYPRVSTANPPPAMGAGIYLSAYPELDVVPGYPVYYAPQVDGNYFFYDGLYWVFQGDNWYASSWYSGPWDLVDREYVPPYVLRVPVRYYRQPPSYFRGWRPDAAPRWAEHWGRDWEQRRSGWDQWDRRSPHLLHHCRSTRGSIPGTAILVSHNNNTRSDPSITATSRLTP